MKPYDIHLPHLVQLAKRLIAIESSRENTEQLVHTLRLAKNELQGYYPMEEFESNGIKSLLVHNTSQKTKHFKIILNAHLDVVPAEKRQFKPIEKNGKLFGRGAYDMKAAAAVMIYVFKQFAKSLPYPIGLQLVTDEESGGTNGTEYQIGCGIRSDFVLFGESTNFHIFNEGKGRLGIKLTAKGKSSHSGYPWLGDNAIVKIQQAIQNIKDDYPEPKREVWQTLVNVLQIGTSNTAINKIPADAYAYLDVRFTYPDMHTINKKIKSLLHRGINYEVMLQSPPHLTNAESTYIKTLQQCSRDVLNRDIYLRSGHGFSDLSFYNQVGCAGVEFGPLGGGHHGDNEWVNIASLRDYYYILKQFLLSIK